MIKTRFYRYPYICRFHRDREKIYFRQNLYAKSNFGEIIICLLAFYRVKKDLFLTKLWKYKCLLHKYNIKVKNCNIFFGSTSNLLGSTVLRPWDHLVMMMMMNFWFILLWSVKTWSFFVNLYLNEDWLKQIYADNNSYVGWCDAYLRQMWS